MNHTAKTWSTTPLLALASAGLPALCPPCVQAAASMSPEQAAHAAFPDADRFDARTLRVNSDQLRSLDAVAPVRQRGELRLIDAWDMRDAGREVVADADGTIELMLPVNTAQLYYLRGTVAATETAP